MKKFALGTRKTFFNGLRALTHYIVFDSWDDLFLFMEQGLAIPPEPPNPVSDLELLATAIETTIPK